MSDAWQHQIRVTLDGDAAAAAIEAVLAPYGAALVSQLAAFEAFLGESGQADTPLGRWTAATLADPAKRAKHAATYAVRVQGAEVYDRVVADAIEVALAPLVGQGGVASLSRHDTNPAGNIAIPAQYHS